MKAFVFIPLLLLQFIHLELVHSEKILVLSFFASKSHKITYMRLIEELANKGHQVTVITPIKPLKEVKNIKEVYTLDVENDVFNQFDPLKMKERGERFNILNMIGSFLDACNRTYQLPQVQEVIAQDFDLVFMQPAINECALGIVYKMKAPLVIFSPTSVPDFIASKIGTSLPTSFVPHILMDYTDNMNFLERFLNLGITVMFEVGAKFLYEPWMEAIYRDQLGDQNIPSVRDILGNASLILSNGHFSLSGPRPYLPDVVDVGGIHSRPAKSLPKDLEKFVSKSGSKGFIYFSMGSIINTDSIGEDKRQMFLQAFKKLKDYQIVWKWNNESMPDKPENVYLSKWLPQQDLLGHKGIKMFITHCGGGGLEEAIYHGVPLLGMPIMGDQPLNAKQAKRLGIMYEMDWMDVTEEALTNGINEVLQNPKYMDNVKKLSTLFRDQPDDPLTRGVYWIEYVMRHKGAPHLRSPARKLNYLQYHSWDVMGAYLFLISSVLFLTYYIIRLCLRALWSVLFGRSTYSSKKIYKGAKKTN